MSGPMSTDMSNSDVSDTDSHGEAVAVLGHMGVVLGNISLTDVKVSLCVLDPCHFAYCIWCSM